MNFNARMSGLFYYHNDLRSEENVIRCSKGFRTARVI